MDESRTVVKDEPLMLRGLDGGNPLAFLAALGALRVGNLIWPARPVRMGWCLRFGAWRPVLHGLPTANPDLVAERLARYCRTNTIERVGAHTEDENGCDLDSAFPHLTFDQNTSKLEPERFRRIASEALRESSLARRSFADFIAAFGSEAVLNKDGYVQDTALRTMSGAGHQHFLGIMATLAEDVRASHIRSSLFERWSYADPLKNHSMRWDPNDDKRHAYQWRNPTKAAERATGCMWGANRLAVEALPLLPTMPSVRGLETTGFNPRSEGGFRWRWPVWEPPISVDTCAALLASQDLHRTWAQRDQLRTRGVVEVFENRRITVGKFRNFTPSRAV